MWKLLCFCTIYPSVSIVLSAIVCYAVGQSMHHSTDHTLFLHFLVFTRHSQVLINVAVSRIPYCAVCLYIPGLPEAWFEKAELSPLSLFLALW